MSTLDIQDKVEGQQLKLDYAKAVLSEISAKCSKRIEPGSTEAFCFLRNLLHLSNLLNLSLELLDAVGTDQSEVIDLLIEQRKEHAKTNAT